MKWVTERLQKENEQLLSELLTFWWERVDSNHRSDTQQIYSLPHLATLELSRVELVDGLEPPTC